MHPEQVLLEPAGVLENRRFHIVDADGRRYNQLRKGKLVQIKQEYDAATERLALHFPDGTTADGRISLGLDITTDFYGRLVDGRCALSSRRPARPSIAGAGTSRWFPAHPSRS